MSPAAYCASTSPSCPPISSAPQPDYEAPTDTGNDGTYEVTVEVGDGVDQPVAGR